MRHFAIHQRFTLQNFIFFLRYHSRFLKITFYTVLSLFIFFKEVKNINYFDSIRNKILSSKIFEIINFPSHFLNYAGNIIYYYNHLKEENSKLSNIVSSFELDKIKKENNDLKELLNFQNSQDVDVITTKVAWIIDNKTSHYGIINIGSSQGVKQGQAVINKNALIGKIIKVSDSSAKILFLHDPQFRIPIKILSNGEEAIANGRNDKNSLKLSYLNNQELEEGDYIVTAGEFPNFAPGLPLGRLKKPDQVIFEVNWKALGPVSIVIPKAQH